MQLQPKRPPGRTDRKAAAYASEVVRLRGEGYTYEAIREALAEVGIELSTSALRREVRRLRGRSHGPLAERTTGGRPASPAVVNAAPSSSTVKSVPRPAAPAGASSRELAEAFFADHLSHPLLRPKETT